MTTTSNYGITLVEQAQAQKEVTINQALTALDALVGNSVADKDLATPPGSPTTGVMYIIAASPTGAWVGHATHLTYFDQIWRFIVPQTGQRVWVADESAHYKFDGAAWVSISSGVGDVVGPASATDNAVARFDSATGKLVQDSVVTIADATGNMAGVGLLASGAHTVTSAGASALAVGANGATNPAFVVDASTASQAGGWSITGGIAAGTSILETISSGANQGGTIRTKGSGNLVLQSSGSQVQVNVGGSNTVWSSTASSLSFTNVSRNFTSNTAFLFTGLASGAGGNSLTAGSEVHSFFVDCSAIQTHGSNTAITLQRDIRFVGSTHAFQTATGTITNAAAVSVSGAPIAGTNCAITNSSSIYIPGTAVGSGTTNSYGLNVTANTGATNNYAARFAGSAGELASLRTDGKWSLLATNTAGGTTGAQTINKPSGTVNFAAAATSLVVTNSLCTTSSIVFAVVRTNDSTAVIKNVVPAAGSFTITLNAAATAETSVGFFIIN